MHAYYCKETLLISFPLRTQREEFQGHIVGAVGYYLRRRRRRDIFAMNVTPGPAPPPIRLRLDASSDDASSFFPNPSCIRIYEHTDDNYLKVLLDVYCWLHASAKCIRMHGCHGLVLLWFQLQVEMMK